MGPWRGYFHVSDRLGEAIARRGHIVKSRLESWHNERAIEAGNCCTFRILIYVVRRDSDLRQRLHAYGVSSHSTNTAKQRLPRSRDGKRSNLERDAGWHNGPNK